jgi:Ni/Co efflux regulator RcnB
MRSFHRIIAVSALALTFTTSGITLAQGPPDQDHQQYVEHKEWKKGYHLDHDDWARGVAVSDWQARHLRKPPAGYEWRTIDGHYVLANPDGVISTVVVVH